MNKYICIHGHFYQPPRINPWLETLEVQDSARPYHDWNQAVNAECYAPNMSARILGQSGTISEIINNYEYISFNFGPTLLGWLEEYAPRVHEAVIRADQKSIQRLGQGNAMAQAYNHVIMPLATERDKRIQVRWGVRDFQRRFGRRPRGMWLPETAVDTASLECLAAEGIEFTVLAPRQAQAVRPAPDAPWQTVDENSVDTRRAYKVLLPSGRSIAVFVYDGQTSRAIAFERLLGDGAALARRLRTPFDENPAEAQLVNVATDGESYGHHHRFGEMALAFALHALQSDPGVELINYAAFLDKFPPVWELRIVENSSWSCAHGVERWRSDCGCAMDPNRGWNQKWRTPLRQSLDRLKEGLDQVFDRQGADLLNDPMAALEEYADHFEGQDPPAGQGFFAKHGKNLDPDRQVKAVKLLESQRWAQMIFTSCAWFFDDLAGIEVIQNLRFAARALELARELGAEGLEDGLLEGLKEAQSNQPRKGNGADIWRRSVAPARVDPQRANAHAAIVGLLNGGELESKLYCWRLESLQHQRRRNLGLTASWGRTRVWHHRIGQVTELAYGALHIGGHHFKAYVCPAEKAPDLDGLEKAIGQALRRLDSARLKSLMRDAFHGEVYSLADLFIEGRRQAAELMLQISMDETHQAMARLYEANRDTFAYLKSINVLLPPELWAMASTTLRQELVSGLKESGPGPLPARLEKAAREIKALGLDVDSPWLIRALEETLARDVESLDAAQPDPDMVVHASQVLDLAEALELKLNLWQAQNNFSRMLTDSPLGDDGLKELGRRLNFDIR